MMMISADTFSLHILDIRDTMFTYRQYKQMSVSILYHMQERL